MNSWDPPQHEASGLQNPLSAGLNLNVLDYELLGLEDVQEKDLHET